MSRQAKTQTVLGDWTVVGQAVALAAWAHGTHGTHGTDGIAGSLSLSLSLSLLLSLSRPFLPR